MKRILTLNRFDGGMTVSAEKMGPAGSFLSAQSIDFRKKPNQFSILPATADISQGVVTDLIQEIVQVADGTRYALGDAGNFYKITSSNVVSKIGSMDSGGAGMIYRQDLDSITVTGDTSASKFFPVSTGGTLQSHKYGVSDSATAIRVGGAATYVPKTTLSELAADLLSFQLDIEPLYSVKIKVVSKGTGDWTVTLHDDANNLLGSKTLTNATLLSGQFNEFVFSTPVRLLVSPNARTYHVHVTSTVADGTLACATPESTSTSTGLASGDYKLAASRFVNPNNGLHPAIQFLQFNCFGNERYLSVWEPLADDPSNLEWLRHRLTFPPGYEVCGLAVYNEFLAIACEKRSTSSSKEYQDGKIFFWDGGATTYNYFVDVPEGAPYALTSHKNTLTWFAGGSWWGYAGAQPQRLKNFPNVDSEFSNTTDYTVVYPNMTTVRKGILLMGYPSETSNLAVEHGVYSWGAVDKNFSNSFGYSYLNSTGAKLNDGANNLRLGALKNFGDTLYLSWRNDSNTPNRYGLDVVNNSSTPFAVADLESLIFDNNQPYKQKKALTLFATFKSLPAGATVTLKYKIDREATWQTVTAVTSGTYAKFQIAKNFYDIQFGVDLTAASLTPEILTVGLEYEDNREEARILE
jgi:hypothetical protein